MTTNNVSTTQGSAEPHLEALLRHFADLRDGTHGDLVRRADKERLFTEAVTLLDPYARQALREIDETLLLNSGQIELVGPQPSRDGGLAALWTLSWREQERAGVAPITIHAHYGRGFHHPHLRGGTVGEWPLNVFSTADAAGQIDTLRAIAAADLHNLVFQADFRIVPATRARADGRR
ncbi:MULTISPECIES: hypothetical protein [unclassified Micromonospora]|uniref:hypothetical protein n=1 Tax=unclassified Micromonospora TaxID=2617518 RepID=UPI0036395A73